jgi:hypothetical protein
VTAARSKERFKIRLQALQIAAQLPEDPHKALWILDAATAFQAENTRK